MAELPGFIELVKAIGTPGLLFGLLYLFMRLNAQQWSTQRADDNEKWKAMGEQMKVMVSQVLAQHKEERDRDFQHLQEQMQYIHGQHETMTMMATTLSNVQNSIMDTKKAVEHFPTYVREIHGRLDILIAAAQKEKKI